jgi:hypothetical protein
MPGRDFNISGSIPGDPGTPHKAKAVVKKEEAKKPVEVVTKVEHKAKVTEKPFHKNKPW